MPSNSLEADETLFWGVVLAAEVLRDAIMPSSSVEAGEVLLCGRLLAAAEVLRDAMMPKSSVEAGEAFFWGEFVTVGVSATLAGPPVRCSPSDRHGC